MNIVIMKQYCQDLKWFLYDDDNDHFSVPTLFSKAIELWTYNNDYIVDQTAKYKNLGLLSSELNWSFLCSGL